MPALMTLRGPITFSQAKVRDANMVHSIKLPAKKLHFECDIIEAKHEIEANVARHLGLRGAEKCVLSHRQDWMYGSFNVCVPVYVDNWRGGKRVIVRFTLPYKAGEEKYPGNADEKLRCEAATYVWIQENCPDISIPHLWGFAFSNGYSFTALRNTPVYFQLFESVRRGLLSFFGYSVPCRYRRDPGLHKLPMGYLVMDYIAENDGRMLSESWEEYRHDKNRRANLFKDMARIMISLGRISLPRIGSFTLSNEGVLSLSNRPLIVTLHELENEGIPTYIPRTTTYDTVEPFFLDLLAGHDSRLISQPNAMKSAYDGRRQMASLTGMRSVFHRFYSREFRHGPFLLTMTDMHQSNIFVDDNWHIKYLIDLEWACSLPIEMQHPPYWLTSRSIDNLCEEDDLAAYNEIREEFMDAFKKEETNVSVITGRPLLRTQTMKNGWDSKKFWYYLALDSVSGLPWLFFSHIQTEFTVEDPEDETNLSRYWSIQTDGFILKKLEDHEQYKKELRQAFPEESTG